MELHLLFASAGVKAKYLRPLPLSVQIEKIVLEAESACGNALFLCIKGRHYDSHADAPRAAAQGAVVVGSSPASGVDIVVENSREALSLLLCALYRHPDRRMQFIGVTGTNGKTTVSHLLWQLLLGVKKSAGWIGTLGAFYAGKQVKESRTTPQPEELWRLIADMNHCGIEAVSMEVSSQAIDQSRTAGIRFSLGVFTNLTRDHLDYHGDMERYFAAKEALFSQCRAALINIDDPYGERLYRTLKGTDRKASFSAEGADADYQMTMLDCGLDGGRFTLFEQESGKSEEFFLPLIGKPLCVDAALAIVSARLCFGVAFAQAKNALRGYQPVRGRAERITVDAPFTVICDYAHTPDALKRLFAQLHALKKPEGRLIAVYGCGGERDKGKRPLMAAAGALADVLILTSDNPRGENPENILKDMKKGLLNGQKCSTIVNRTEAISFALEMAKKDDIVALCGKGHEDYQIVGDARLPMDERELVKQAMREIGAKRAMQKNDG